MKMDKRLPLVLLIPLLLAINASAQVNVPLATVEVISVDATSDIGPVIINYRVVPSGRSISSVRFTAPGITETRANVSGNISFSYNHDDLPYGNSQITLTYGGNSKIINVSKTGVGKGPRHELVIATIPVDPGWVHWPISHRLTEGYARITYSGATLLDGSYTLHVGDSHVTIEADSQVTINWAHEKHRYRDNGGTHLRTTMSLQDGDFFPPTESYRKYYRSDADKYFRRGRNLRGIAQLDSVMLDGILPINIANENIAVNLE